jgi:hypothetical protein
VPDEGPQNQVTTVFARSPYTALVNLRLNDFTPANLRTVSFEEPRRFFRGLRDYLDSH